MLAFHRASATDKIENIQKDLDLLQVSTGFEVPETPARDIEVLPPYQHPPKKGLSKIEGQGRLLHDLASIEMQAMELGLRTLNEFPEAPAGLRSELSAVTASEGSHLKLCLQGLEKLGYRWGDWPAHCSLWYATSAQDTLIDRMLIVHRYLEGSGLDAGDQILNRLKAVNAPDVVRILTIISDDEVQHVDFGSRWYRRLCLDQGLDPERDFAERMWKIKTSVPRRVDRISRELRKKAGFTDPELKICEDIRQHFLSASPTN
jgi:uncharacterized ferritin-like protein (DUF455 family)